MVWAALTIAAFIATVSVVSTVVIAVKLSRNAADEAARYIVAHQSTLASLERIHDKQMQHFQTLADRFMAMDFQQFKSYQLSENAEEGGFEYPEEWGRVERPMPGGRVAVSIGAELSAAQRLEEEKLLREDFPDEDES